jgi:hypothetical protein
MKDKHLPEYRAPQEMAGKKLPKYEPPQVITYTDEEVLEGMGPAQAVSPYPFPDP